MTVSTYDLSGVVINPVDEKPMTVGGEVSDIRKAIITAFKMAAGEQEKVSEDDLNFRRKIIKKIKMAEDLTAVPLKSKAVQAIKEQVRKYYIPGVAMQIYDVLDGEPTDASLEDV